MKSRDRNLTKAKLQRELGRRDERLERYLEEPDAADRDDDGGPGGGTVDRLPEKSASIRERRARPQEARKTLEASGEDQLSLTDPEPRAMHASSRVGVGHTVQIAVDTKLTLIAEAKMRNKVSDLGLLAEPAETARDALGVERIEAVADRDPLKI